MQRLYSEKILPADTDGAWEVKVREAFERIMERAAPEFNAPTRATCAQIDANLMLIYVVVEETEAGFRPLGS